jgi:hypothetical protein
VCQKQFSFKKTKQEENVGKNKKIFLAASILLALSGEAYAIIIDWETTSPISGGVLVSTEENNIKLGKSAPLLGNQPIGIYGAGFYTETGGYLDAMMTLFTWDSWNYQNGFKDHFLFSISHDGFYWEEKSTQQKIMEYGGISSIDSLLEKFQYHSFFHLEPDTYVSFYLETTSDASKPSFGEGRFTFVANTIAPVPEPTTMLLFGTGLVGLAGVGRKKREI